MSEFVKLEIVGTKKKNGLWQINIVIAGFKRLPDLKKLEEDLNGDTQESLGQSTLSNV